jgi:hypothetical protein
VSAIIATSPVWAQETPASAPPASSTSTPTSTATTPAAPANAAPSEETLKKAKAAGLHAETRKGATVWCYEDANLGTRFTTKKCVDGSQLDALIAQRQAVRDNAMQRPMTGTGSK